MQVFGNVATQPQRKQSKSSSKGYFELRLCESQRGVDTQPTWYTVRVMKDKNPELDKGDFVKVTGKLKTDFYVGRDGKPTGTLLIIAFEASKIAKPAQAKDESKDTTVSEVAPAEAAEHVSMRTPVPEPRPSQQQDIVKTPMAGCTHSPVQMFDWAD